MKFTKIVYLDPSLISSAYEEIKGISPVTRISRSENIEGGASAGFFRVSGASKETNEYVVSTSKMFYDIEDTLREAPKIHRLDAPNQKDIFWIDGILSIGSQSLKRNENLVNEIYYFTIANEELHMDSYLDLAANDSYFTSGYDRMATSKDLLGSQIWEPVESLLRPIYSNHHTKQHLFAPIVILRTEGAEQDAAGNVATRRP